MITYPSTIPQPSTSFSGDVETPTIRTDIPNGLTVQEGRFSTGRETFRLAWVMSQAEFFAFEEWFAETLAGGTLVFGLLLPDDGAYSAQPVRFVGGTYDATHKQGLWFNVTATAELMTVRNAPSNRTPPVPQWLRLGLDPAASQVLNLSYRNALLTVRPDLGSLTTLRIYPPTDPTLFIYFGVNNQGLGDTLITSQDVDPPLMETVQPFPAGLPNVNATFGQRAQRRTIRADMDSGHARQFLAAKSTQKTYQATWEFSLAQLQTFQDFFFVTLKSGAQAFTLKLPVDGDFVPVPVRFVGGKYSEEYVANDRFKVSAALERVTDQTVSPPEWQPFPLYYAPTVNVTENRKIAAEDAGKLFVVTPELGQTISLHIYAHLIEFGVLVKGLGNVLITRGPFIVDIGTLADTGESGIFAPSVDIIETLHNLGSIGTDTGFSSINKPEPSIQSVVEPLGSIGSDTGTGSINKPEPALKVVLEDIGNIGSDTGTGNINKPTPTIDIP